MIIFSKKFKPKKLTDEQVIDIMTDKTASAKELAERHGINLGQIYKMHKGLIWKHITCDPKYKPRNFIQEKQIGRAHV